LENVRDRGYFWTLTKDERYTAFDDYRCLFIGLNTKYYMTNRSSYIFQSVKLVQKVEKNSK
jgi:hypothetical protein